MFRLALFIVVLACVAAPTDAQPLPALHEVTIAGVRVLYRLSASCPCPTILTFAGTAEDAMHRDFAPVADALLERGWLNVSLDLPGHGRDARPTEGPTLLAWRQRTEAGEDWIGAFASRVRTVLDYGIAIGAIDPTRIVIVGYSRGGFLALHVAARDERIAGVAAIQPVTDLHDLDEFWGVPTALTDPMRVQSLAFTLGQRAVWLSIGWADTRVNTQSAIDTVLAARAHGAGWSLLLHPERDGPHTFPGSIYSQAAMWLALQRR